MTHCESWDATTRVLSCSFAGQTTIFADGSISDPNTSPAPRLSGLFTLRVANLMRYGVEFHFNEALTKASVLTKPVVMS